MSEYYNPQRTKNMYVPGQDKPFKLSRTKVDLFINCPRCFYLDRRLGVGQPPGYPFSLNSAVDTLLKKEFDIYRAEGKSHPLMVANLIDAIPLAHPQLDEWRDSQRRGITYHDEKTNLTITGGVDDLWVTPAGEFIVVDYKATAKKDKVSLDAAWQIGYKRQMEIYQWLFKMNGFKVSDTGYFVYCNGKLDREAFHYTLNFTIDVIPYIGDSSWVDAVVASMYTCLNIDGLPTPGPDCDFCKYRGAVKEVISEA